MQLSLYLDEQGGNIESKKSTTTTAVTTHSMTSKGTFSLIPNSAKVSTTHSDNPTISPELKKRQDEAKEINNKAVETVKEAAQDQTKDEFEKQLKEATEEKKNNE